MANEAQLAILKQGVDVWNKWREENRRAKINLNYAGLRGANLRGYNLREVNLDRADLNKADLSEANIMGAHLSDANLRKTNFARANLSHAYLIGAHLREADLRDAQIKAADLRTANLREAILREVNLTGADLSQANLTSANLREANLRDTNLIRTNFLEANLIGTIFSDAVMFGTIFANSYLNHAIGLESVHHLGPSNISTNAFGYSEGKIPEVFLRGCGLSDWEVEIVKLYNPNLSNEERNKILYRANDLTVDQVLQISPLFVSYSHADREFVDRLGDDLTEKGVRFWRDIHDMKSGRIEKQIDRAIRQNPTVLLVLSKNSLSSDWVEHEVRTARGLEKEMDHDVLCPITLDDSWKDSHWPKRVMEQIMEYNILDFSDWKDESKFGNTFSKLIDGLELFYKG